MQHRQRSRTFILKRSAPLALCLTLMVLVTAALSQDPPAAIVPPSEIDLQRLTARISELSSQERNGGEFPPASAQELALLRETQQFLDEATAGLKLVDRFAGEARSAPEQLAQIDTYLATPADDLAVQVESGPKPDESMQDPGRRIEAARARLQELTSQLEAARVQLQTEQNLRAGVETDAEHRGLRRTEIPAERAQATERLETLKAELAAGPAPDVPDAIATSRRWRALAEQFLHQATLRSLDEELRNYDARRSLLDKRRAYRDRRIAIETRNVATLQEAVGAIQIRLAAAAEEEAKRQRRNAANSHSLVLAILDQNQAITSRRSEILKLEKEVRRPEKAQAKALFEEWEAASKRSKAWVDRAGLTNAIGQHLRNLKSRLPDMARLRQDMAARDKESGDLVNEAEDRRILNESLTDIERTIKERKEASAEDLPTEKVEIDELDAAMREALLQQQKYLDEFSDSINDYLEKTVLELQNAERNLYDLLVEFTSFIDERILWIRSAEVLSPGDIQLGVDACIWLLDADGWAKVGSYLWQDVSASPVVYGLCVTALMVLLVLQPFLRQQLRLVADKTKRYTSDRFALTAAALLITVLMAIAAPAWIAFVAWRLSVAAATEHLGAGLSTGMFRAAGLIFLAESIRILCRRRGLGEAHFRWKQPTLLAIRRPLRWLVPIVVPLTFIVGATSANSNYHDSLGRMAFIVAMLAYAVFVQRVFRPSGAVVRFFIAQHRGGWVDRLKYVWFPLLVLAPIAMAVVAGLGYFYSAVQLEQRVFDTFWLLLLVSVGRAVLLRGLFLAQRRLDIEQRRKKQAAQAEAEKAKALATAPAATERGEPGTDVQVEPQPKTESEEVDLAAISAQTRQLLNTSVIFAVLIGLALVWFDMLPALNFFREVELWAPDSATVVVAAAEPSATDGAPVEAIQPEQGPITLGHVVYSVLILLITILLSRNLPGLLEIALLQRLPISPSGRYAITTIARYTLVIVGLVIAFGAIGIGWSKVQWLAAAITVGLGFGLQEIFANFVSGLIILFERPIRVGDTVTVGGINGTVTRLRIRATTITDWDRKELIIPNKEFVTGQIVNWTLSDPILRIIVPVGIAYGSDTKLAEELLYQVAKEDPAVLDEPEPRVIFEAFGNSSLDFSLRVFIANIETLMATKHRLHNSIDRAFRDAGIVIAFPQRDVHVYPTTIADGNTDAGGDTDSNKEIQ